MKKKKTYCSNMVSEKREKNLAPVCHGVDVADGVWYLGQNNICSHLARIWVNCILQLVPTLCVVKVEVVVYQY